MKIYMIFFLALFLAPVAGFAQSTQDTAVNAAANANLVYAPSSYYEAMQDKRFHLNWGLPHLMHPQQAPLPRGFEMFYFKPLANAVREYSWSGEPDSKNVWSVDYFRNPPNRAPIVWLNSIPADENTLLLGYVGIKGKRNEQEPEVVKRAIHNAKHRFGTSRIQVAKRTRQEAAQWGASLGSGGSYGQVLGKDKSPDDKMVVLGAGAILGYSEHWIREYADVIVYAYSDAIAEAPPTPMPSPVAHAPTPIPPPVEFVVGPGIGPIFYDIDKDDQKDGQSIYVLYEDRARRIAEVIVERYRKNALPRYVIFSGSCDYRGSELYNMGSLGPRRAQKAMNWVGKLCIHLGIPAQVVENTFVFVSAGHSNRQNSQFYFELADLNRRVDVAFTDMITEIPTPQLAQGGE